MDKNSWVGEGGHGHFLRPPTLRLIRGVLLNNE